eukprot:1497344-Pyramimonas_sp.AAC.1
MRERLNSVAGRARKPVPEVGRRRDLLLIAHASVDGVPSPPVMLLKDRGFRMSVSNSTIDASDTVAARGLGPL